MLIKLMYKSVTVITDVNTAVGEGVEKKGIIFSDMS